MNFKNTFAPMVRRDELTTPQIIQLLKIQVIEFDDLPEKVGEAVEDYFEDKKKLDAMEDEIELLEAKVKLQGIALQADTKDEKGRWITTEKKQRVFIPEGADMKETVEKAIQKRKNSDSSKNKPKSQGMEKYIEYVNKYLTRDITTVEKELAIERAHERIKKLKDASPEYKEKLRNKITKLEAPKETDLDRKRNFELNKMTFDQEFNRLIHETEEENKKKGKSIMLGPLHDLRGELLMLAFNSLGKEKTLDYKKLRKEFRRFYDNWKQDKFFGKPSNLFTKKLSKNSAPESERQKTRNLIDEALKRMDEKTLESELTRRIENWKELSPSDRKHTLERIRDLFKEKPKYRGPEIPSWSKFNESFEREKKLRNKKREKAGKSPMTKKEEATLHNDLVDVWQKKIDSYEPKKKRSPEIEERLKKLSEKSRRMKDEKERKAREKRLREKAEKYLKDK